MHEPAANPFVVFLLFLVRCLAPVLFLLGLSYLLRRLGLIEEPAPPPPGGPDDDAAPPIPRQGGGPHA